MLLPSYQFVLRLLHALEMEVFEAVPHEGSYLVVAEVANRSLMGVVDVMVGLERAGLNLQSHLL